SRHVYVVAGMALAVFLLNLLGAFRRGLTPSSLRALKWMFYACIVAVLAAFATAPLLYVVCGLLLGLGVIGAVRRLFKGTVSSRDIRRDLNLALATVLCKSPVWNEHEKRYDWKPKKADSQD